MLTRHDLREPLVFLEIGGAEQEAGELLCQADLPVPGGPGFVRSDSLERLQLLDDVFSSERTE